MKAKKLTQALGIGLLIVTLAGCAQQSSSQAEYIGLDAAKAIALEDAGVSESVALFSSTGLDRRNNVDYYEVDFTADGQEYEYDIDAVTGVVIERDLSKSDDGKVQESTDKETAKQDTTETSQQPATTSESTASNAATATDNTSTQTTSNNGTALTAAKATEIALADAGGER